MRVAVALLLGACTLVGQNNPKILDFNRHGWFSYSGDHPVKGAWGIHFDAQWRRADIVTRWQQYQLRPGINYQAGKNVLLTLGYVYTKTYPYGDFPGPAAFPEHRIYQQVNIKQPLTSLTLSHRVRLEQRFIRRPNGEHDRYQNRFRYMFRAEIPISDKPDEGSPKWYVPVYDEIVIGIGPNNGARAFDQNRLFAGIGRSISKTAKLEAGYLKQFSGQRNGRIFEFNNTLFVTVTSTHPLSWF